MIDQHESVLKSISNCIRECWVLYKSYKNAGETFKQITSKVRRLWASLQEFHNDLRFSGFISISGNNEIWDVWSTWTTELKYKIHEREVAMVNYRSLQAMQTIGPWGRNMSLLTPEYETKIIAEIDTETNETIANINTISSERNKIESEESNTGGQILQDIKLKLESIYQDIVEGKKDPSYVDTVDRDTLKKELMEDNVTEADFELNKDTIQEWLSRVQQNKEFTEEQTRKSQPARPFSPELYSSSLTSSPHIAPRDVTLERLTPIDEVRSISMDEGVTPAFRYESGTAYTVYSYDDDRSDILGQIGIKEVSEPDVQELSSDSKGDEARSGLKNTSPAATALGQVPHQSVNLKQTKYSKGGSLSVSNATLDSGNKMAEVNTDDNKPRGANEFKEAEDSDTLIYRNQKSWDVDPNSSTNSSLSAPGLAPGVTSRTFALSTPDKDILSGPTRHGVDSGPPRSSPEYSRINIEYLDVTDPRCKPSEYVQVTTFTPMLHNLFVNTEIFLTRSRFIHRADLQMKDHESGIDWHGDIKKVWNNLQIPLKRGIRDGMRVVLVGQGDYIDGGYKDLHVVMKPSLPSDVTRQRDDLYQSVRVSLARALCGPAIEVHYVSDYLPLKVDFTQPPYQQMRVRRKENCLTIKVDKPLSTSWTKKIPGLGLPNFEDPEKRGSLYLRLNIVFPHDLSKSQKQMIQAALGPPNPFHSGYLFKGSTTESQKQKIQEALGLSNPFHSGYLFKGSSTESQKR